MTTNATPSASSNRISQMEQAAALKVLIGSASVALVLVGWGWLSSQQAPAAETVTATAGAADGTQLVLPIVQNNAPPARPAPPQALPTLAPLYAPAPNPGASRSTVTTQPAVPAAQAPVAQAAPPPAAQLRAVTAPPQPVAVTRSSR